MGEATPTALPPRRRTSKLAIAALVTSVAGPILWFFSALVIDYRNQTTGHDMSIRALYVVLSADLLFALIALTRVVIGRRRLAGLGLAVAGVLVSLFGLFVVAPVLREMREAARGMSCEMSIQNLGAAAMMYAQDHGGRLPPSDRWCDCLSAYTPYRFVFVCPEAPRLRCGYAFNRALSGKSVDEVLRRVHPNWDWRDRKKLSSKLSDDRTVLLYESDLGWNGAGGPHSLVSRPRHRGKDVFCVLSSGSAYTRERNHQSDLVWNPPQR